MVTCRWCLKEMNDEDIITCDGNKVIKFPDGTEMDAFPYKNEYRESGTGYRCHDCNIKEGGYHHPNCDMERCPRCGGQLISCGCLDDEQRVIETT